MTTNDRFEPLTLGMMEDAVAAMRENPVANELERKGLESMLRSARKEIGDLKTRIDAAESAFAEIVDICDLWAAETGGTEFAGITLGSDIGAIAEHALIRIHLQPMTTEPLPPPAGSEEKRWDRAVTLLCPFTRFESPFKWLTLEQTDPCPQRKCGLTKCHNYGKPFADGSLIFLTDQSREEKRA